MGSYWDVQAYEAQMKAAQAQTAGLTPEAPISFAGMTQLSSGVPSVGFNQTAYAAQQKSATGAKGDKNPPKPPKPPKTPKVKLYGKVFSKEKTYAEDGTKTRTARDPTTLNKQGLKKYTANKLGIKSTYTEPKNTATVVANSNTGRLKVASGVRFMGKSSLVIKKAN
jgi:hypothetical protein